MELSKKEAFLITYLVFSSYVCKLCIHLHKKFPFLFQLSPLWLGGFSYISSGRLSHQHTCSWFLVESGLPVHMLLVFSGVRVILFTFVSLCLFFWLFHVLVVHLFSCLVSILGLYSFYFHSSSSFFSKKESYHIRYCLPARCTYYAHLIYNCTENYEYLYVPVLHVFWDLLIFYLCRLELMF